MEYARTSAEAGRRGGALVTAAGDARTMGEHRHLLTILERDSSGKWSSSGKEYDEYSEALTEHDILIGFDLMVRRTPRPHYTLAHSLTRRVFGR